MTGLPAAVWSIASDCAHDSRAAVGQNLGAEKQPSGAPTLPEGSNSRRSRFGTDADISDERTPEGNKGNEVTAGLRPVGASIFDVITKW